jgi:hypothetical protein
MEKREKTKRDWLFLSSIVLLMTSLLTLFLYEYFWSLVPVILLVLTWILIIVYILANVVREYSQFAFRKYFLKITERKFYTSPFFLMILGLLFLLGVVVINLICGQTWGLASVVVLLVPYAGMILNIYQKIVLAELKKKKKKKKS